LRERTLPVAQFLQDKALGTLPRVPGSAVFMTGNPYGSIPPALLHNIRHNRILHERVVLLTVVTEEVPRVDPVNRLEVEKLGHGFFRLVAHYGFMESPDVPDLLSGVEAPGFDIAPRRVSYFLGREKLIPTSKPGMAIWREKLFALMSRNAQGATSYYRLPSNQVVELGAQVEI